MAREDARWFIAAAVVLSVVLFFALPMSLLIYIDTARLQAEVRYEVKQLKKLRQKESENVANRSGNRSEPHQQWDAQSGGPSDREGR
jgi:hypothetical protein